MQRLDSLDGSHGVGLDLLNGVGASWQFDGLFQAYFSCYFFGMRFRVCFDNVVYPESFGVLLEGAVFVFARFIHDAFVALFNIMMTVREKDVSSLAVQVVGRCVLDKA